MKKLSYLIFGIILAIGGTVLAAPYYTFQKTLIPEANNSFDLGTSTSKWRDLFVNQLCLSADCRTTWPSTGLTAVVADSPLSGSGTAGSHLIFTNPGYITSSALTPYFPLADWYSTTTHKSISSLPALSITKSQVSDFGTYQAPLESGVNIKTINSNSILGSGDLVITATGSVVGTVSTSTTPTLGQIPYWTSTAYPSLLDSVATSSLAVEASISSSGTLGSQIGGTASTLSLNMANPNSWTGLQTFANSSTTNIATVNQLCFTSGECMSTPTTEGSGISLYPNNVVVDIGTYESLLTEPLTSSVVDESCNATSGYCAIDTYISTTTLTATGPLVLSRIPAGTWSFEVYSYLNSATGDSKLEFNVKRRTALGVETQLFQATTTDINSLTPVIRPVNSVQPAFEFDPTDRLILEVKGWTDSGVAKTVHWLYGGTSQYSHVNTPITTASEAIAFLPSNNTFTGLNTFSNSTTSLASVGTLFVTGVGTSTVDGNLKVSGNLEVSGASLFSIVSSGNTEITGTLKVTGQTTLATSLTGLLKGTSGVVSTASAGSDYENPLTFTWPLVRSTNAISWNGISTSTIPVANEIAYWSSATALSSLTTATYPSLTELSYVKGVTSGIQSQINAKGAGTVTSITAGEGLLGGAITSSGTFYAQVGTSSLPTIGNLSYWTGLGTGTVPAKLGTVATTTLTATSPLSLSQPIFVIGGSASTLTCTTCATFAYPFPSAATSTLVTFSNGITLSGGTSDISASTVKQHVYQTFAYSTSTAWTATTTIALGVAFNAELWSAVKCYTDVGTLNVSINDGTNRMNMFNASTTIGTVTLSTNNTFTASEKRYIDIGTPATAPTKISCTTDVVVNN